MEFGRFSEFREAVMRLPSPVPEADALGPDLLIEQEGSLEIFYAPMEWVRPTARVVIVGITPGKHTMRIALETAVEGLRAGESEAVFLNRVKSRASFSGMRRQLITWLNELDVHIHLELDDSSALWTASGERLLQPTSSVRYPVLKNGANYSGSSPTIIESPMLRRYIETVLTEELDEVADALVVPLGRRVDDALSWLIGRDALDPGRVLSGFPHPSGANGHRHRQWSASKTRLREQVARWFS